MLSTATKKTVPFSTIDTGLGQCFTDLNSQYLNAFQNACKLQITPLYYKYPFILFIQSEVYGHRTIQMRKGPPVVI